MPMTVEEILARAKEAGASDVHITVGIPPKMRVNGDLLTMEGDRLMPADTLEIAAQVMNEKQQQRFEENGECDMSFAIAGQGRYRVNIYKQRGSIAMAFRLVDTKVPSAESLGVPQSVIDPVSYTHLEKAPMMILLKRLHLIWEQMRTAM